MPNPFFVTGTYYPPVAEVGVAVAGIVLTVLATYRFQRRVRTLSDSLFGVLNRHFKALGVMALMIEIGRVLYFVMRATTAVTGDLGTYRLVFDLAGIAVMGGTFYFGLRLIDTIETLPDIYEADEL